MQFSAKGRYGLRAMVDLAAHAAGGHVALSQIAERQEISGIYLEQIFSVLRKAGLVTSVKGAQGGYALAGDPERITVGAILRALEGDLSVVGDPAPRTPLANCLKEKVWDRMSACMNELVDSVTLAGLVEDYHKYRGGHETMFYI